MKHIEKKFVPAGIAMMISLCMAASAAAVKKIPASKGIEEASAETELFEDGLKVTSVTLRYTKKIQADSVTAGDYRIDGRVITGVSVSGKNVTITLDCSNKLLAEPDWNSMDDLPYETKMTVTQTGEISSLDSKILFTGASSIVLPKFPQPKIVERFTELTTMDNSANMRLRYDIFMPDKYAAGWNYPLVIFVPDAHVNTNSTKAVLLQGQGATVWTTDQEQSKHKCIVVAVQYTLSNEQEFGPLITDEGSMTPGLSAIKFLIDELCDNYRIDRTRIYGVGQAQGANAIMTLSENYPALFAATMLVAPQKAVADPTKLAGQKIWLQVCSSDAVAYSRANLLTDAWENAGAKVSYGMWRAGDDAAASEAAAAGMITEKSPINCGVFEGGNHPYTWTRAYEIEAVRDWIFRQHR